MSDRPEYIAFAGLAPHPPIIVPSVGKGREEGAAETVRAMRTFAQTFMENQCEVLVLVSPHSPRKANSFGYFAGDRLKGSLKEFGARHTAVDLPNHEEFLHLFRHRAHDYLLETWAIEGAELDHGAMVPLSYLWEAGWRGPTVVISLNAPGKGHMEDLGRVIEDVLRRLRLRGGLIASGDMSHRLAEDSPGGYNPAGNIFDARFVEKLQERNVSGVLQFDRRMSSDAGEDVLDVTIVALSACRHYPKEMKVLSYEGPFGVGYCVAVFLSKPDPAYKEKAGKTLLEIARHTLEQYVRSGRVYKPDVEASGYLARRAGVFVTIHRKDESLRGCIGVISPTEKNLVKQTVDRAVAVARWAYGGPVVSEELDDLVYDVNVLTDPEPIDSPEELDPIRYGVIMTDDDGNRALLLPRIPGITTVREQIEIVRKKAGIASGASVTLERFETDAFHESPEPVS